MVSENQYLNFSGYKSIRHNPKNFACKSIRDTPKIYRPEKLTSATAKT